MKLLVEEYSFDKTAKQVLFSGSVRPNQLEEILLITNVTTGDIIYNFADKLRGGSLSGSLLTLDFDTSAMQNTDRLQIFIDSDVYHNNVLWLLQTLLHATTYSKDAGDRMRVIVDNGPQGVVYNRNSSTALNASAEVYYSASSWNTVDAREQLMAIHNNALINAMSKWRIT